MPLKQRDIVDKETLDRISSLANTVRDIKLGQGSHGNLFDNCLTLADQKSKVFDARSVRYVDVFGYVDTSVSLSFQLSQDNTNFYTSVYHYPDTSGHGGGGGGGGGGAAGDFHVGFDIGANYLRISCDVSGASITATAAGK